jgi:hypothetical protein
MEKFKSSRGGQFARNSSWWQAILDNFVDSMQVAGGGKTVIAQKHVEHDYKK